MVFHDYKIHIDKLTEEKVRSTSKYQKNKDLSSLLESLIINELMMKFSFVLRKRKHGYEQLLNKQPILYDPIKIELKVYITYQFFSKNILIIKMTLVKKAFFLLRF